MSTDALHSRSALAILKSVSGQNGMWTWYNISTRVDQIPGVEKNPPVYHVLKQLVASELLRTEPPEGGNMAVYFMTEKGKQVLAELTRSPD